MATPVSLYARYTVDVPSFGPWGFHLAAAGALPPDPARLHLAVPTRYLTDAVARDMFDLPPICARVQTCGRTGCSIRCWFATTRHALGRVRLMLTGGDHRRHRAARGQRVAGLDARRAGPGAAAGRRARGHGVSLLPGDIVQYTGTDYVVDSTIRYEQDGVGWQEHLRAAAIAISGWWWKRTIEFLLALVEVVDDPDDALPPTPIDSKQTVTFRGQPYKLRERAGRARRGSCPAPERPRRSASTSSTTNATTVRSSRRVLAAEGS